jgi:FtsH-binding integral membrane protein
MEATTAPPVVIRTEPQAFLVRVFGWMFAGLAVTGIVAGIIGSNDDLLTKITESPVIMILVIAAQLGLVIWISAGINRMSPSLALGLFFVYAGTVGVTFALIFELYTAQSIFSTFLVTSAMFGGVALFGYVTKRDLSTMGTVLFMALFGLIAASIVNLFVANETLYWVTTYAGVLIFAGLTAYDMQKIKGYAQAGLEGDAEQRASIMGALALYLDFINLFLFLLRIFGQQR